MLVKSYQPVKKKMCEVQIKVRIEATMAKAAFTLSKFSWSKSVIENLVKVFFDKINCLHYQSDLWNLYKITTENA